jgi:hypothetical protein
MNEESKARVLRKHSAENGPTEEQAKAKLFQSLFLGTRPILEVGSAG